MPTFRINHYIPSLGSSSAGSSEFTETVEEAIKSVRHSLLHMAEEDKIVIERIITDAAS